jgi:hypothetical protein
MRLPVFGSVYAAQNFDAEAFARDRREMAMRYREGRREGPVSAAMARGIYLRLRKAMRLIMGRGVIPREGR